MLIVETIGRIRREHLGKGKSIKEIARTLHLSRNTVRRILRSGETAFSYEREVQPRPKLGPWTEALDRLLTANAEATARERLTLIRIYEELRPLGYAGGYDAVRRYARRWGRGEVRAGAAMGFVWARACRRRFDLRGSEANLVGSASGRRRTWACSRRDRARSACYERRDAARQQVVSIASDCWREEPEA